MRRIAFYFILAVLVMNICGCASMQKKFTRKKKQEDPRSNVILALEEYDKLADYHELYKKHYLLWQYWHDELINSIKENYKKQKNCAKETLENLSALKKYISADKQELLDGYIMRVEEIKRRIDTRYTNKIEQDRMSRELEKIKRLIDKEYRYSEIQSYVVAPEQE